MPLRDGRGLKELGISILYIFLHTSEQLHERKRKENVDEMIWLFWTGCWCRKPLYTLLILCTLSSIYYKYSARGFACSATSQCQTKSGQREARGRIAKLLLANVDAVQVRHKGEIIANLRVSSSRCLRSLLG